MNRNLGFCSHAPAGPRWGNHTIVTVWFWVIVPPVFHHRRRDDGSWYIRDPAQQRRSSPRTGIRYDDEKPLVYEATRIGNSTPWPPPLPTNGQWGRSRCGARKIWLPSLSLPHTNSSSMTNLIIRTINHSPGRLSLIIGVACPFGQKRP